MPVITLEENNVYMRGTCALCGGPTEKNSVLAYAYDDDGEQIGEVCHGWDHACLEKGSTAVQETLLDRAERLRDHAAYLERLAGLSWVKFPTAADCNAMRAAYEDQIRAYEAQSRLTKRP